MRRIMKTRRSVCTALLLAVILFLGVLPSEPVKAAATVHAKGQTIVQDGYTYKVLTPYNAKTEKLGKLQLTGMTAAYKNKYSKIGLSIPTFVSIGEDEADEEMFNVVSIKPGAFKNNKKITDVWVYYSITKIPKDCFKGCSNLRYVCISGGLEKLTISSGAFSKCKKLKNFFIDSTMAGKVKIKTRAFKGVKNVWVHFETEYLSGKEKNALLKIARQVKKSGAKKVKYSYDNKKRSV